MKKLKSMLKKSFAALLVTCLAVAPALSTTTVNAEETGATAISYQASIEKSENGSIQFADTTDTSKEYSDGEEVELMALPDSGYSLASVSVKTDKEKVDTNVEGNKITFKMPTDDVKIKGKFEKASDNSGITEIESSDTTEETEDVEFKIVGSGEVTLIGADDKKVVFNKGSKTLTFPKKTAINLTAKSKKKTNISINMTTEDGIEIDAPSVVYAKKTCRDISLLENQKKVVTVSFGDDTDEFAVAAQSLQARASEAQPEVGDKFSGYCSVGYVDGGDGHTVHSVTMNYSSGILGGTSSVSGCADHYAAAPVAGQEFSYVFTVTSVDKSSGTVTGQAFCTALEDSTDGNYNPGDTGKGYQRVSGTTSIHRDYNGKAQLKKSSSMPNVTNGNNCYSLAGAQYAIYSDAGCTIQVGTFTTDENGVSQVVELPIGTYYLKEITAPKGYVLSVNTDSFSVSSGQTTTVSVSDQPGNDPMTILLSKIDAETGKNGIFLGAASLADAQFTINYYDGYYDENTLPEKPTRTWIVKTIKMSKTDGSTVYVAGLDDRFKVSGDDFYYTQGHSVIIPLGTISVEETKAPSGYKLENKYLTKTDGTSEKVTGPYVSKITLTDDIGRLEGGNEYIVSDYVSRGDFEFTKKDEETKEAMANIPFRITSDTTGESYTFVTDENGYYSSSSKFNPHSQDTNGGNVNSGLWFGQYTENGENKIVDVNDDYGALPYDTYTIEELKCDANSDKALYKGKIKISRDNYTVDMGTIENPDVTITTNAKDAATNSHYANPDGSVTIIDNVSYTGLKKSKTYTINGILMNQKTKEPLLDQNGNPITATKDFKPKTAEGSVEVEFTFDARGLDLTNVTVFEECYLGDVFITDHKDINSEQQTIHFPSIHTTAKDSKTETNISMADGKVKLYDTVSFENVKKNETYLLKARLMDQDTGKILKDCNGNEITAEKEFKAESTSGTVDVVFEFDGSNLAGKKTVVFEKLTKDGKVYAKHEDLKDEGQSITFPEIKTNAKDSETGTNISKADEKVKIIDEVSYTGLIPNKEYELNAHLVRKDTKEPLKVNGEMIVSTKKFTPTEPDGSVEVEFEFDGSALEGKTVVAFESLEYNKIQIAVHADINDKNQSIDFPAIKTNAQDSETNDHLAKADGLVTLVDHVSFDNLNPGESYDLFGRVISKETQDTLQAKVVIGALLPGTDQNLTLLTSGDYVYVESNEKGIAEGIYQKVGEKYKLVGSDEKAIELSKSVISDKNTYDKDTYVYIDNGKIIDVDNPEYIYSENKQPVTRKITFVPKKSSGTVDVTFQFDASELAGQSTVVFEDLLQNDISIASHEDINDKNQTVNFPKIQTEAKDAVTGEHVASPDKKTKIIDSVFYDSLIPGKSYEILGKLYIRETGEPLLVDGKEVTGKTSFTPDKSSGTVEIEFEFDASALAGKTVVAFEDLRFNKISIGSHEDINDEQQSVSFPKIGTTAIDQETNQHITMADNHISIKDNVTFDGLIPNKNYVMVGRIVDQKTGNLIKAKVWENKTNIPNEAKTYHLSGGVVYLLMKEYKDDSLSIESGLYSLDNISETEAKLTNVDNANVTYTIAEEEATLLMQSESCSSLYTSSEDTDVYVLDDSITEIKNELALSDEAKEIVSEKEFTPDSSSGSIDITFDFDGTGLEGTSFVVFEECYLVKTTDNEEEKVLVGEHQDISDEGQTVHAPKIQTTAVDTKTQSHIAKIGDEVTIKDSVRFDNLIPGLSYKATGVIMDKDTKEPLLIGESQVTSEAAFTPTASSGYVDVSFTFNASDLKDKTVVVFETLTLENEETGTSGIVAEHQDINDEGQSVKFEEPGSPTSNNPKGNTSTGGTVKTSDQNAVYLLFALCLFIISCIYGIRKVRHK